MGLRSFPKWCQFYCQNLCRIAQRRVCKLFQSCNYGNLRCNADKESLSGFRGEFLGISHRVHGEHGELGAMIKEIFKDFEILSINSSSGYFTSVGFYINMLFTHGALMRKIFSPLFFVMNSVSLILEWILVWFFYEMLNLKKLGIMRTIVENHYKQFTLDYIIVLKNSKK